MTVRKISIEAYQKHIDSGKQSTQWMRIYAWLGHCYVKPRTRSELASDLGMRMSSVCGRVNELIKAGLLVEDGRRKCAITNESAHPIRLPEGTNLSLW